MLSLVEQLCLLLQVPPEDWHAVRQSRSLMMGDAAITFASETWSGFVKAYVEIGRPMPADAPRLHRFLLSWQMLQPAPFVHVLGLHPETDRAYLCCAVPFPRDDPARESFVDMLHACVEARQNIRASAPEGIAWE